MIKLISTFGDKSKIVLDTIEIGDTAKELKRALESRNTGVKSLKSYEPSYGDGCLVWHRVACEFCSMTDRHWGSKDWSDKAEKAGGKMNWPKGYYQNSWLHNYLKNKLPSWLFEKCTGQQGDWTLFNEVKEKGEGCLSFWKVKFNGLWDEERCLQQMRNKCEYEPCSVLLKTVRGFKESEKACKKISDPHYQAYDEYLCGYPLEPLNTENIITYELHYSAIAEQKRVFIMARNMLLDSIQNENGVLPPYGSAGPPPQDSANFSIHFRKVIGHA
mmetsp:Transcript_133216/g.265779  ORF Transcript_133216/g.265779 Transcript_133216/m.265779 type:complete len:273 (-) Transcript_133216:227-1045(-)